MFGYIYETTNLINGKKYIGKHKSSKFDNKYYGSGVALNQDIEKYGKENFSIKIIEEISDDKDYKYLSERECSWIEATNAVKSDKYYNNSYGGENEGWQGINKARKENPDYYKKHHWSKTGKYNPKNRKYSKEEIEGFKNRHWSKLGYSVWNKGVLIPKEQQTEHQKNFGPICKGTIWINNNKINKRIQSKELDYYLNLGWQKGRKLSQEHIKNLKGHIPWNKGLKLK